MQRKFIPYKGTQAARPERAEALSPGQRPILFANLSPCKGKSFKTPNNL